MATKYIRFLTSEEAAALPAGQAVMVAVAVDAEGNPVDIGGGESVEVADGSVTTAKLAASAVTAEKIADGTITAGKLAAGVIPTLPGDATTETAGLVKQATHVDGASGTVQNIVDALVASGAMASA